ncbi:hypothetical protein JF50_13180 [Pseudoalteromonas luteoviolacea]|uniref:Uncharacterized protein n=1 Tax=Pseudoalteromonas luteoviolacea TaxID=43657 RepID=A0A0C1QBQ6_9GAMM|nr:hypothetical protein [Pseudoalteromonas luteoviolacea]KID56845.1 hypothetical protein JF50_13180 [Pseudoalteromonas luteoviolacea]
MNELHFYILFALIVISPGLTGLIYLHRDFFIEILCSKRELPQPAWFASLNDSHKRKINVISACVLYLFIALILLHFFAVKTPNNQKLSCFLLKDKCLAGEHTLIELTVLCLALLFVSLIYYTKKRDKHYGLAGLIYLLTLASIFFGALTVYFYRFDLDLDAPHKSWVDTATYFNNLLTPPLLAITSFLIFLTWQTSKSELHETKEQLKNQQKLDTAKFQYELLLKKLMELKHYCAQNASKSYAEIVAMQVDRKLAYIPEHVGKLLNLVKGSKDFKSGTSASIPMTIVDNKSLERDLIDISNYIIYRVQQQSWLEHLNTGNSGLRRKSSYWVNSGHLDLAFDIMLWNASEANLNSIDSLETNITRTLTSFISIAEHAEALALEHIRHELTATFTDHQLSNIFLYFNAWPDKQRRIRIFEKLGIK